MAATPESKVKERVKKILAKYQKSYWTMPVTGGYGASGAPDIMACVDGKLLGIECKANGNKPTALQLKHLQKIAEAGGYSFVVDDQSIGVFILALENVVSGRVSPQVLDLTREEGTY